MRPTLATLAGALALAGCASGFQVRSTFSPELDVSSFRTFELLPTPRPHRADNVKAMLDPAVDSSMTNVAVRQAVTQRLEARGYTPTGYLPDFLVIVYASANEGFGVPNWSFGYPHWAQWDLLPSDKEEVVRYAAGTVVVDLVTAANKQLLWRGAARATMTTNAVRNMDELRRVAQAIVDKVPRSRVPAIVMAR